MKQQLDTPHLKTPQASWPAWLLFILCIASTAVLGCSRTRTSWLAAGEYQATLTDSGIEGDVRGTLYKTEGITSYDEVGMCEIRNVTWSLPFPGAVQGEVASVVTRLPQALCRVGTHAVSGGSVLTWQFTGTDTTTLSAKPAEGWTVTGTVTITGYTNLDPDEPDVYEKAVSETVEGTFELEARGPEEAVIRFENGTFQFEITIEKWPFDPFN